MSEYEPLIKDLRSMARPESVNSYISYSSKLHAQSAEAIQALQEQNEELAKELAHSELNILSLEDKIAVLGQDIFQARNAALEEAAKRMDNNASILNDAADNQLDPEAATGMNIRANYYKDAALVIRSLKGE